MRNRDKLLGVAAMITFLISVANALEYFFAGKNYLSIRKGIVTKITRENYDGSRGAIYTRTVIHLNKKYNRFYFDDKIDNGAYVNVSEGDSVVIYARKWYQFLYNYESRADFYCVEKGGEIVFDRLDLWKIAAFLYMCIFGGCALLLLVMYLDQVKNISISNWFQKRFRRSKQEKS